MCTNKKLDTTCDMGTNPDNLKVGSTHFGDFSSGITVAAGLEQVSAAPQPDF